MATVLIVGTAKGVAVLRSDAARTRWSFDGLDLKGWIVTAAARDPGGRYYLGVTSDVYGTAVVASDDLRAWEPVGGALRYRPDDAGNPEHNRIIAASDPPGIDRGSARHVNQIWKLATAGDRIYAGVSEAGLFRSDDRGKTWEPVAGLNDHPDRPEWIPGAGGLCAHSILVDGRNPDRLWVGISAAGVFRSDDGGRSFVGANQGVSRDEGYCVHALAHDPQQADVIYRQDHRGMYRTRDGGEHWEAIENGLPESQLSDDRVCVFGFPVAYDPRSGSAYVVPLEGDNFRIPHDGKLRVYRTQDGGDSWRALGRGLPDDCYAPVLRNALALDGHDPCGVYLGTTSGSVYASADRGESWQALEPTLPRVHAVAAFDV